MEKNVVALDVGKTFSKLSLWDGAGHLVAREVHANRSFDAGPYIAIDVEDIEAWLAKALRKFAALRPIECIVPVTHGAGGALIRNESLACPIFDYESSVPESVRDDYDPERDAFVRTGSPKLAHGLNLGVQLFWMERLYPDIFCPGTQILTYPQYWAWRLCGVTATEVTSLGCHTDLWFPNDRTPSRLATSRGWAELFAPIRGANDILGTIRSEWVEKAALPKTAVVRCGIHDSNASILAARGYKELQNQEFSTLSTGTWFVSMRTLGDLAAFTMQALPEGRDCLVNVDRNGNPVPTSLFMGGREIATLAGTECEHLDVPSEQAGLLEAVERVISANVQILPTYTPGIGPFPASAGAWYGKPANSTEILAATCLYTSLVAETCLSLLGCRERVLIDGRFAKSEAIVRVLATLRSDIKFFVSNAEHDASFGALHLAGYDSLPYEPLQQVQPLQLEGLLEYATRWRAEVAGRERATIGRDKS